MSLDFEDLCLDPFQSNFDEGHREGRAAGLQAGFNEGRKLGQQKAIEVGIELGYMRGVAEAIRQAILVPSSASSDDSDLNPSNDADATHRRMEKVGKSADELLSMIDAFPSPDEIFHQQTNQTTDDSEGRVGQQPLSNDTEVSDSEQIIAPSGGPVDISGRMQRIRAKFKLLCVQLKMPEIGLTKVMEDAKKNLGVESGANSKGETATGGDTSGELAPGGDQDW